MSDEQAVTEAAILAEQIVDEISRAEQDWAAIVRMANRLARIAADAARSATAPQHPDHEP